MALRAKTINTEPIEKQMSFFIIFFKSFYTYKKMKSLFMIVMLWMTLSSCYAYDIITNSSYVPPTAVNPDNLSLRVSHGVYATRFDINLPSGFHGNNRCVVISTLEGPFNTTVYGTENNILLIGNPQYSLSFRDIQDQLKYTVSYSIGSSLFYSSTVIVNTTGTTNIYYNGKLETVPALVGEAPLLKLS
jgi:hypothetical protein